MIRRLLLLSVLSGGVVLSVPALADVKAGVDAWARGDYPAAVREWGGPATDGDADAQFNLAQAYKLGRGVPQDLRKAEKWFGRAAAQGHVQASDNYGLLLFDRGEHTMALPYIKAAADRADPRAQYLLGIAHFNGDLVAKDWVRAYALMSLARSTGLPQAGPAMTQMDSYIPLPQRQQAAGLAQQLAAEAEANRSRQLATADLGSGTINPATTPGAGPVISAPVIAAGERPVAAMPSPAPAEPRRTPPTAEEAIAMAERVSAGSSPRTAGADYARPAVATVAPVPTSPAVVAPAAPAPNPVAKPAPTVAAAPAPKPVAAPVPAPAAGDATWRIQFGAFGVAANADALWAKLAARPEVAGHTRINARVGAVVKLQAGQYTQSGAQTACGRLSATGITCIAVRN